MDCLRLRASLTWIRCRWRDREAEHEARLARAGCRFFDVVRVRRAHPGSGRLRPAPAGITPASRCAPAIPPNAPHAVSRTRAAAPGPSPIPPPKATNVRLLLQIQGHGTVASTCCVSGVRGTGVIEPRSGAIEFGVDRNGGDYRQFDLADDASGKSCGKVRRRRAVAPGPMCDPAMSVRRRSAIPRTTITCPLRRHAAFRSGEMLVDVRGVRRAPLGACGVMCPSADLVLEESMMRAIILTPVRPADRCRRCITAGAATTPRGL